jgi:carboxyl-terminal processing protease
MRRSTRTTLLIVAGLVAAGMLVFGGFLLGVRDDIGSALRGMFPVAAGPSPTSDASYQLQQEVLDKLKSTYYKQVDETTLHADAVDGMIAGLDDPYTVYWDPEEYAMFKESTAGEYTGVGMTVRMKDHLVTVVSTFEGSPAEQAGIRSGDIILSVDGESVQGMDLEEVVSGIKGVEGTAVGLEMYRPPAASTTTTTIPDETGEDGETTTTTDPGPADLAGLPPGGETQNYTLTRKTIEIPVTDTEIMEVGDQKVALITLSSFSQGSAAALRSAVEQAVEVDGADAIILDLRSNGGGLLDQAVDVASVFIPEGEIVSTEGLHSPKQVYTASGEAYPDIPLYVLTDPFTASASEIVAGALQDYERATLVGETTFGKGLVQSIEPLSNGGALKATTAVYLTPEGRDINKKGISPDVVAPDDPYTENVDETVQAVIKLILDAARVAPDASSTTTVSSTTGASSTTSVPPTTGAPSTPR